MGTRTRIEWTDMTWNPVRGCSEVSTGCKNCYAKAWAGRFSGPGKPWEGFAELTNNGPPRWTGRVELVPKMFDFPMNKKPSKIFVNSMSDLFHENLSDTEIASVFGVMLLAQQHVYQVLTKRPERARVWYERVLKGFEYKRSPSGRLAVATCINALKLHGQQRLLEEQLVDAAWPMPHLWFGVSMENQEAFDKRWQHLAAVPARVKIISAEPLLGPIDFTDGPAEEESMMGDWNCLQFVDQVIVGCESGRGPRPMEEDWVRGIRDQAIQAGCCFFYKQRLAWGKKEPTPTLDGVRWTQSPPFPEQTPGWRSR